MIDVKIRGYTIYCESDNHELYDFFVPMNDYRLSKKEAQANLVPEAHTLLAVKRDYKTLQVEYEQLLKISEEI